MSRPDVSESTLRGDTWINCLRELMAEHGKIKVPKLESYHLRDEITEKMNENKGNVTVKQFVDLVTKYFGKFIKKKGFIKGKSISVGARAGGVNPNTDTGRKWWVDGCGGDEKGLFINNYIPSFVPGGGWIDDKEVNSRPDETTYFNDLLMCLGKESAKHMPEEGVLSDITNIERASLKKKRRKKKKTKKKKPYKKRRSPKKKKGSRKKKKSKR